MLETPEHWTAVALGEITSKVGSGATPRGGEASYKEHGVPLIRSMNVHFDGLRRDGLAFLDVSQARALDNVRVVANDVLLNITGASIGRACLAPVDLVDARVNQHVCIIRLVDGVSPSFVWRWLSSPMMQRFIADEESGATRQALTKEKILAMQLPLPPANEQRRIVAKIDAIFEQTRAAKARLERLPELFIQLKRSILAAAFRGDLTADWREDHPNVEPAIVLAQRIRAQRDARTSLPDDAAYSSELPDAELPATWSVALTANVGSVQLGRQLSAGKYTGALHPYVRVANVADDRLSFDDIKEMEFSPQELEQYLLRPGDIVLSEGQSLDRLGQSAMYRAGDPAVCYQKTLNRFRATQAGPLPEYAQLYFRFCMHTGVFRAAGSITTNIAHLTQEKLRRIPFILCPLEEQRVLVERVRGALARLETLEAAVATARTKLAAVEEAALAKAFRGELAEQDPTDEPASALLARIRSRGPSDGGDERLSVKYMRRVGRVPAGSASPSSEQEQ